MKLKKISSDLMIKFLESKGYFMHHIKGSHFVLYKQGVGRVVVPKRKELPIGTTTAILREVNSNRGEFFNWFKDY
jgi:predicted RNA binding protein YcfA (HicA-like mRNA interferase family)